VLVNTTERKWHTSHSNAHIEIIMEAMFYGSMGKAIPSECLFLRMSGVNILLHHITQTRGKTDG
jgi:hypothetical protein